MLFRGVKVKFTEQQLQAILSAGSVTTNDYQETAPKASKYHNVKININGIYFDSLKESRHYLELLLMERMGLITNLELQPVYILQEAQGSMRAIKYIADFRWVDVATGKTHVKDSKGFKNQVYRIKEKLFRAKFPDLVFEVG